MRSQFLLASLAVAWKSVAALSGKSSLQLFESLHGVPQGWTRRDNPEPATRMRLRIALAMPDHAKFEQTLYDISTPSHPTYGQHLTHEEVRSLVKPRDGSVASVLSWLQSSGVAESDITQDNEWINFYVSVASAEAMMDTTFSYFTQDSDDSQTKVIRTLHVSLPSEVSSHISMIQPTTRFGQMRAHRKNPFSMEVYDKAQFMTAPTGSFSDLNVTACNTTITPDCLRALYNVGDFRANPSVGGLLGVCGYLEEYAKFEALEDFEVKYAPYAVEQNFTYVLINGGLMTQNDTVDDDGEANLDMQYAASLGFGQDITYYSTGGRGELVPDLDQPDPADNSNEPYLDFLTFLVAQKKLPQTITTSYGEDEQSIPASYTKTACNLFGQLGLRGVSVIFSSGDDGPGSACQTNDGKNTTRFLANFPASCPYVTSVGATQFVEPEAAVSFSAGGFSDRFPRPAYQEVAVKEYLNILGDQWEGLYNPNGRGVPDVAAQGVRFHVIEPGNRDVLESGTSASSPAFAGIVSLLNNARLSVNLPPLGFLNPWLYSIGKEGLTDIVHGGSKGCTGRDIFTGGPAPFVPFASWNATTGWDPVTGLGTPNFGKMLELSTPINRLQHI